MLTLALKGEKIVLCSLELRLGRLLAKVKASLADERAFPVVIRYLTKLFPAHDRVCTDQLPIFFH